jgi:hypothetical protein
MMNLLRNAVVALLIASIWTVAVCNPVMARTNSLVVPTNAQAEITQPEQMGPFVSPEAAMQQDREQWGTRAYFDNNNVLFSAVSVSMNLNLIIGGSPQVRGGLTSYQLGADEQWMTLEGTITVITMAANGKAYIGKIHKGEVVLATMDGKIKAIKRCGNWARQIGARFTITCPPSAAGPCQPDPRGMTERSREQQTLADGSIEEVVIKSDDCKTEVTKIITKPAPPPIDNSCVAGNLQTLVHETGRKKPVNALTLIQEKMSADDWHKYGNAITQLVNSLGVMATDIQVVADNCNVAVGLKIIQKGGIPMWVYAAMVGLFIGGIFIGRMTAGKSTKTTTTTPGVKTQNPGSGDIKKPKIIF